MYPKSISIFTDGACRGNPGPGGWATILEYEKTRKEISGFENETTNNRMELTAVIKGLSLLKEKCKVTIVTDSEYVKKGMTIWLEGWVKKDWKTSAKKPVKNVDLWKKIAEQVRKHEVKLEWVRGHSGHPENERCDTLANKAIDDHI